MDTLVSKPEITVLCGGFGAARFLDGFKRVVNNGTCIVNTGDDLKKNLLHISPDVDSVIYSLADLFDEDRGFGIKNDTFKVDRLLSKIKPQWFHIGDQDLKTHLSRTFKLITGKTLAESIETILRQYSLNWKVLPMSDQSVSTVIVSSGKEISFQDFIVKFRGDPKIDDVIYKGSLNALPAPGVVDSIENSQVVIIAPSSPIASIGPMLAVKQIRNALLARKKPIVAVSPVISAVDPLRPAEIQRANLRQKFLATKGYGHNPYAVADMYKSFIDCFILDYRDIDYVSQIESLGIEVLMADLLVVSSNQRKEEAQKILDFVSAVTF